MSKTHRLRNPRKVWHVIWYAVLAVIFMIGNSPAVQASTPVEVGYRDFQFPAHTGSNGEVTAEKPESKLWWNDGFWWAGMWEKSGSAYHIFKLDVGTQTWGDTGTPIDDRSDTKIDTLWDGVHLYVVSHIWAGEGVEAATLAEQGRLYRYNYDAGSDSYTLDSGFPVEIGSGKTETLVIAKDTAGTLWVTYAQKDPSDNEYKVWVNHSVSGDDLDWREPYVLPGTDADNLSSDGDDISSIIAYGSRIGVMWSNQTTKHMYFAMHLDGDLDSNWSSVSAYTYSADDHINLKSLQSDSAGSVFAVIKTSKHDALIVVLVCSSGSACISAGNWSDYPVYTSSDWNPTRPNLLIDTDNRHLYVFTRNKDINNDSGIYFKIADMDNISFPTGLGVPFIISSLDDGVNDPTSTKQNVNSTTGIVVLASDSGSEYYLHNYLALSATNQPVIYAFSPISGTVGTEVTLTGANLTGTTGVTFNGTPVTISPTIDNDTQVRVTVPAGATTGPISLTTASGTDTSADDFTVPNPPEITSFNPTNGSVGTLVTLTGNNFTGTTKVEFNITNAPGFIVDSNTQIRVNVPTGATTGPIKVTNPSGYDISTTSFTVTQGPLITSFDPTSGVVGTIVTITGENFTDATEVRFYDGVVDSSFVVDSDTQITAHLPSGSSTGPISVDNPSGTGTSASDFTVIVSPTISSFSPVSGPVGTSVTLTGSGFTGVTSLEFNGIADSSFVVDSDTQISAHVPSGATTGPISVTNLAGSDSSDDFTVIKTPEITSFDPTSGPVGTSVTISGSNFTGVTDVSFGGISASIFSVDNDNQITASVPLGAVTGKITVENLAGVGISADVFTVTVPTQFTLTIDINGSGSVTLDPPGGVYNAGTNVTLTPVADAGWVFNNWSGDLIGSDNPGLITMDGDKTITANFFDNSIPNFYLTAIPIGNGTISLDPPGGVYQSGTVVTVTATADPGWEFSSWSGDLGGTANPAMISMDDDKVVNAHFVEQSASQYSLSLTTSGVGSVILDPPGGIYNAGTVVKLTALPAVGWAFNGWGGDLSGMKNPENIIMDGNKSVTLKFNQVGEVRMLFIPGVMKSYFVFSP